MRSGGPACLAGAVVVATMVSGCTSTFAGTASPAAAEQPPAAAQLQRTLLQPADLPAGWTAETGSGPDQGTLQTVAACLGKRDSWKDVAGVTVAPSFADAVGDEVGQFTASYHAHRDVADDVALFRDAGARACFARAFDPSAQGTPVPEGASVGSPVFTVVAGAAGGPRNVAGVATGSLPVTTAGGQDTTIHVQFVLVTGRLTEAQLFFLSVGAPLAAGLRSDVITAVAERVARI